MIARVSTEKKCWGSVAHVFHSLEAATSFLNVDAGWQCSRHYHKHRANQFFVISGRIIVEEWAETLPGKRHVMVLGPGMSCVVQNMNWHRFKVLDSGSMVEVYWSDRIEFIVRLDDIVRYDVGGKFNLEEYKDVKDGDDFFVDDDQFFPAIEDDYHGDA